CSLGAVGKSILQHQVFPLLQERRAAIPVKRMLKNDDIVAQQQLLLAVHVHEEIGVFFIEIVDRHILQGAHGSDELSIDSGFLESRMSKLNQNSFGHWCSPV